MIIFRAHPFTIELKHPFTISTSSRTTTPAMIVEIEKDGIVGYGEASMPPYLGETQNSAETFFSKIDWSRYSDLFLLEDILSEISILAAGNKAAKAAVDIALYDWMGKVLGQPLHRLWGLNPGALHETSFTIGIDRPEVVRERVAAANGFHIYKVKLGGETDKETIAAVRSATDKPLRVDVNQGWTDREEALAMCEWLAGMGVEFVEQPLPVDRYDDAYWLHERSPIPIIADESVGGVDDIRRALGAFDGINVKLMKAGGLRESHTMILVAKSLGLRVLLGCMTETSCAISAAAQLAPLADWIDLDGAALIANDPFDGATIVDGRLRMPTGNGIGAIRKPDRYSLSSIPYRKETK
jgi:L-alanine-DL-glutamate epimerase-like enolase superfamily enzyme